MILMICVDCLLYLYVSLREVYGADSLPVCSKFYLLALAVAVIIYLVSPVDLIPEIVFGIIGLVDDILICVTVVLYSASYYRNFIVNMGRESARQTQ